jgi:Tol biopolymer transport system component
MRRLTLLVAVLLIAFTGVGLAGGAARPTGSGGEIAYLGNGNLYLINANGTDRRTLISGRPGLPVDNWGDLSWSRDGKRIAFTVRPPNYDETTQRIYIAASDGTNVRRLTTAAYGAFFPTWSPDGTRIAFTMAQQDRWAIAVIGADGTHLRTLTRATSTMKAYQAAPDWSPDGAWILFDDTNRNSGVTTLLAIHPDGTGLHQVAAVNTGNHCACGDWSPDGRKIVFQAGTSLTSDRPEIYVMNADGSGRIRLTQNPVRDENPDWSPDGKQIAFYSERRGNAEIYVMGADGGQARRVTHDPWYSDEPAWRPK